MPTIAQTLFRVAVILVLSVFWSSVTAARLLWEWWRNRGTGEPFFPDKPHPAPAVLSGWRHGYLQLSQVRLHYVETGDADGPLMVLLHGFPEFWYSWRHQLRHFQSHHHVVALDLRGYGDSEKPQGVAAYAADTLANDVAEAIEQLSRDRPPVPPHLQQQHEGAVVVGHDWGGAIAWILAMERPELVRRLVILNVPHPKAFLKVVRTRSVQLLKSWYMFMFQSPWLPEAALSARDFRMLEDIFRGERNGLVHKERMTDEDMEAFKHVFSKKGALTPPLNYYRASMRIAGRRHFPVEPIKSKTLIIWGERDCALEVEGAELSVAMCSDARLERIPDSSHWVQQDVPELVNALIDTFLAEK